MFCDLYSSNTNVHENFYTSYFSFQVIYIYILEPVLSPALYLFDVLIFDIYYLIILCYKDLDYSEFQITKAKGGGPLYEFNYNDLSYYSDQVSTNMKYIFHTYVLEAEKFSFRVNRLDCDFKYSIEYYSPKK